MILRNGTRVLLVLTLTFLISNISVGIAYQPVTSFGEVGPAAVSEGKVAPNFTIFDFYDDSLEYNLHNFFDDQVVMLDLMAAWCGPCRDAMPEIKQLHSYFDHTGKFEVFSIGIDQDEPRDDLDWFYNTYGIEWPFARDIEGALETGGSVWSQYGTGYIPTMYLLVDGIVIYQEIGFAGFDPIKEIIAPYMVEDTVAPIANSLTLETTEPLSIDNRKLEFSANITEETFLSDIELRFDLGGTTKTVLVPYKENGIYSIDVEFTIDELYNLDLTEITYELHAEDFWNNKAEVLSGTVEYENILDTTAPTYSISSVSEYMVGSEQRKIIKFTVTDDYRLTNLTVFENRAADNRIAHEFEIASFSSTYQLKLNYPDDMDVSGITFDIWAMDWVDNVMEDDVNLTLTNPDVASETSDVVNSTSSELDTVDDTTEVLSDTTSEEDTTEEPSDGFSIILGFMALIVTPFILRKRK